MFLFLIFFLFLFPHYLVWSCVIFKGIFVCLWMRSLWLMGIDVGLMWAMHVNLRFCEWFWSFKNVRYTHTWLDCLCKLYELVKWISGKQICSSEGWGIVDLYEVVDSGFDVGILSMGKEFSFYIFQQDSVSFCFFMYFKSVMLSIRFNQWNLVQLEEFIVHNYIYINVIGYIIIPMDTILILKLVSWKRNT